jgi:hypothetical protein
MHRHSWEAGPGIGRAVLHTSCYHGRNILFFILGFFFMLTFLLRLLR